MQIFLGADHRGYELKDKIVDWLLAQQIPFEDMGASSYDPEDDFNDYAKKVAVAVTSGVSSEPFGILICGSAQGMAMQANRYPRARAAICSTPESASLTRQHNGANILCLPADIVSDDYTDIIEAFINTSTLTDEKYQRRINKLDEA